MQCGQTSFLPGDVTLVQDQQQVAEDGSRDAEACNIEGAGLLLTARHHVQLLQRLDAQVGHRFAGAEQHRPECREEACILVAVAVRAPVACLILP